MDKFFRQQGSNTQQPRVFGAGLQVFDRILYWVAGLFRLTEEEQRDAGICIGVQAARDTQPEK